MEKTFYSSDYLPERTLLKERYEICNELNQTGDRIIYEGKDRILGIEVIIQEFYPAALVHRYERLRVDILDRKYEEKFYIRRESFLKEAELLEKFSQVDGLVTPIDFFEANNTVYIIMKQLGEIITLKEFQNTVGSTEQFEVLKFLQCLLPVMNGIAALHRAGIIHCGIKPDRIIILNDSTMKLLLDTGTLRKFSIKDTSLSVIFDQHYAPLEVYSTKGELGPWTDIYALCATIYYYLSGDNPVEAIERISGKKLKNLSEYNTSVFPELENVILKGMSVDIKDRYQSMEEFCEALYGVANEIRGFN